MDLVDRNLIGSLVDVHGNVHYEDIKNLPSEVDIIHCKDCKLYKTKYCAMDTWIDDAIFYRVGPDDFCCFGELKDENM